MLVTVWSLYLSFLTLYLVEVTGAPYVGYCSEEPFDCACSAQPHISVSSLLGSSWQLLPNKCLTNISSSKFTEGKTREGRRALYRSHTSTVPITQMGKKVPPYSGTAAQIQLFANTNLPMEIRSSHQTHRPGKPHQPSVSSGHGQTITVPGTINSHFASPRYILYLKEALTLDVLRANTYELLQTVKAKGTNSQQEARNSFTAVKLCGARNMPTATWADHMAEQILMFSLLYVTYFRAFVQTARKQEKRYYYWGKIKYSIF